jgi:hypothetical protein
MTKLRLDRSFTGCSMPRKWPFSEWTVTPIFTSEVS